MPALGERLKTALGKLNPIRLPPPRRAIPESAIESLAAKVHGDLLSQYQVAPAEVFVSYDGETGHYEISEPALTEQEKRVYGDLFESFIYALDPEAVDAENLAQYIEGAMWKTAEDLGLLEEVRKSFAKYRYYISRDLGYGKLHIPMHDPDVAEITAVGYGRPVCVIHRKFARYGWLRTNITFHSEEELQDYNLRLAQRFGRPLTAAVPMADIVTAEGHRVSLTFGSEITHPGSTLSIRKFPFEPFSLAYLVSTRTLPSIAAAYLWQVFEHRGFVQILGSVGAGKTTLLNALLASIDPNAKMITVEDVMELRLPHENWHRFHTRPVHFAMSERFEVSIFDLLKLVMRHRPDYVVVGETRGAEMRNLTHAASVASGTPILVKRGTDVRRISIGEFVDKYYETSGVKDSVPVPVRDGVQILTFSNGRAEFKSVVYVFRHKTDEIFKVRHVGGEIYATGDHSVFTLGDDMIVRPKRVDELKPGDVLISFVKKNNQNCSPHKLSLKRHLHTPFIEEGEKIRPPNKTQSIPSELVLDFNTLKFLGLYLADGCARNSSRGLNGEPCELNVTLGNFEFEKFWDTVQKFAESVGLRPKVYHRGSYVSIDLPSSILARAFQNIFGRSVYEKRVPSFMYELSSPEIRYFLEGYSADRASKMNSFSTVNRELAIDVAWLARIGGLSSVLMEQAHRKGKNKGKIYWVVQTHDPSAKKANNIIGKLVPLSPIQRLAKILNPRYNYKLSNYFYERRRKFVTFKTARNLLDHIYRTKRAEMTQIARELADRIESFLESELEVVRVKSVEKIQTKEYVYDVSVPDSEAFFGGSIPILLHNSLGHSCASSFHSESPEAALARMRADPINLKDDDILRVWCFAVTAMVKRPTGEVAFRVGGIHEVNPTPEGKPELAEIIKYDVRTDTFLPDSAKEVAKRSRRLRESAHARGMTESDLVRKLQDKVKFLDDLVKRRELDYWTYVRRAREFYARG